MLYIVCRVLKELPELKVERNIVIGIRRGGKNLLQVSLPVDKV